MQIKIWVLGIQFLDRFLGFHIFQKEKAEPLGDHFIVRLSVCHLSLLKNDWTKHEI